jgi:hypothetical protein
MVENSDIFGFSLKKEQVETLEKELQDALPRAAKNEEDEVGSMGHLCWRSNPMRLLDLN